MRPIVPLLKDNTTERGGLMCVYSLICFLEDLYLYPIPALKTLLCKACIAIDVGIMWGNRGTGGDFPVYDYLILLFVNDLSIDA